MTKLIKAFLVSAVSVYTFAYSASIVSAVAISHWGAECSPSGVPTDIRQAIMNVTNWVLGFVSMVCVLVIIYGLVSGADTIKYGFVGLVVCGLAYAMVIVVSTVILG